MLYINPHDPDVQKALAVHRKAIMCLIWKKIGAKGDDGKEKQCSEECCICISKKIQKIDKIPKALYNQLNNDTILESLICGSPQDLLILDEEIWKQISPSQTYENKFKSVKTKGAKKKPPTELEVLTSKLNHIIKKVFAYDDWFVSNSPHAYYGAYHLAQNLKRRSCTYCNRNYIATVLKDEGGKLSRPQFDHYFPKAKYPLLALSFFNLIPSCYICNSSIKGTKDFILNTHTHPYIDDINNKYVYTFNYQVAKGGYIIDFKVNDEDELSGKIKKTIEDLHLKEIFESHQSELDDLVKTRQAYSTNYIKSLKTSFLSANLSEDEIYRMAFGVELKHERFHKRPLSKFKYDILKELGIIKN